MSSRFGTAFLAGRIFVFERDKMLKGLPARQLQADLKKYGNKPQYGFLPSDLDSLTPPPAGEAAFVIGPHPTTVNKLASARVAVTWGACADDQTDRKCHPGELGYRRRVSTTPTRAIIAIACRSLHRQLRLITSITSTSTSCTAWRIAILAALPCRNLSSVISRLPADRASPSMERFVGTNSETPAAPRPLRRFFRQARMTPTPPIAGWDRSRWTKTTTSRSATANRAYRSYHRHLYHRPPRHRRPQHLGR